jgi:hypothetical protein
MEGNMIPKLGIVNSYNYWDEIVKLNWVSYTQSSTARQAFNLASSLWHVIEWIRQDERHPSYGPQLKDVQDHFLSGCPDLAVMHDVATSGKHYTVSKPKSAMDTIGGEMDGAVLVFGPGGPMSEHTAEFIVTMDDGSERPLREIFGRCMEYWDAYFKRF